MSVRQAARAWVAACMLCSLSVSAEPVYAGEFLEDVRVLCAPAHRLAGSPESRRVREYLAARLREAGVDTVMFLSTPVWTPVNRRSTLRLGDTLVDLTPMVANITIMPSTSAEGITAPYLYAAGGTLAEYGDRDPAGALVGLDYHCGSNWKLPFALGARGVIFLGDAAERTGAAKHAGGPLNLLRLYAHRESVERYRLRTDRGQIHLVAHTGWEQQTGATIVAHVSGTAPVFSGRGGEPEMIVVGARYDSYGDVPLMSRSARIAANAAGVVDAARYAVRNRPRRDMLFVLFDAGAFFHQGARDFYTALLREERGFAEQRGSHANEREYNRRLLASLDGFLNQTEGFSVQTPLLRRLSLAAEYHREEENQKLGRLRLENPENQRNGSAIDSLARVVARWDSARIALAAGALEEVEPSLRSEIGARVRSAIVGRLSELDELTVVGSEQAAVRARLQGRTIVVHIDYEFSDGSPVWGPVVLDQSDLPFRPLEPDADNPGYYARVLRALQESAAHSPEPITPHALLFGDPMAGARYIQTPMASSGMIAGTFGIYRVALATCFDARPREGTPSDNYANLQVGVMANQIRQAHRLVVSAANNEGLSLERSFASTAVWNLPVWSAGRTRGSFVGLQVSGSMAEDRPAAGAVLAVWPHGGYNAVRTSDRVPGFERFCMVGVSAEGRYSYGGVSWSSFGAPSVLGALFDTTGEVTAISSGATIGSHWRVNLFPARGFVTGLPLRSSDAEPVDLRIMGSATNAPFRLEQSLTGSVDRFLFAWVHRILPPSGIKVFSRNGPVVLASSLQQPYGTGIPTSALDEINLSIDLSTSSDLWYLNESRLVLLREKAISDVGLELLHSRARQVMNRAHSTTNIAQRTALLARSAALSRQVYEPVRALMDDLVKSLVLLLLLSIPFAFCLERLLVCATTVYGRVAWFAVFFAATFGTLYLMHPGFAIAAAPIIVFLAFAIIVLSSAVIQIMARKFKAEIMALQGRGESIHTVEISRAGALLVAVTMGMSTMRRRPVRTVLTAVTAVMLTFTIVCFASFSGGVGIRSFYVGPGGANPSCVFLVRNLNYAALAADIGTIVGNGGQDDGIGLEQWWLIRGSGADSSQILVTGSQGARSIRLEGVLGIDPTELEYWPALQALFGDNAQESIEYLQRGSVFLPDFALRQLGLARGDSASLRGIRMHIGGSYDESALQRLRHIDGQSILPVDFADHATTAQMAATTTEALARGDLQGERDFSRLSASQIGVASSALVRLLGGEPHLVSVYAPIDASAGTDAERIAEVTSLPVWVNTVDGVQRMVFTTVSTVSGLGSLVIPILLGGLIIFGTLLGSITDRQREIYTFSALGLGPAHVGFLFVAEGAVYAVVGGMGGKILAQLFAALAALLARHGLIAPLSINFSSTHSLAAIGIVMITILLSALYPAYKASKSANPGIQRGWKMPEPKGDTLELTFPFTISSCDSGGLVSFLAEYYLAHDDAGLGRFSASEVRVVRSVQGILEVSARVSLAPFDLGVSERCTLRMVPSEIAGVDEVTVTAVRTSGTAGDWCRAHRCFVNDIRKQFLIWRTLSTEAVEGYRMQTRELISAPCAGGENA